MITLYAAGNQGYGEGDTVLGTARSGDDGTWSVDYTCPGEDAELYVVADGGNAGQGENSALVTSAALGACSELPPSVNLDEVTTVASVYSLNRFLDASAMHLGTSSANQVGLANAARMVANLADVATGESATELISGASGTAPTATVNTLADILAACGSSAGPSSGPCTALFAAAPAADGTLPTTTLQAALNMARSPGSHVATLYALVGSGAPFQPVLPAPGPGDFLLPIQLTGGGMDEPEAVAIDSEGDAWVASYGSGSGSAVAELSPAGEVLSGPSGFSGGGLEESFGIAIDSAGNVWVSNEQSGTANSGNGSVTELAADGSILSGPSGYVGSIIWPVAVAIDPAGNVWVANTGEAALVSSLGELSSTGIPISPADGFTGGGLGYPGALAIDRAGNVWVADKGAYDVALFSSQGQPLSPSTGFPSPAGPFGGICLDPSGAPWLPMEDEDAVLELQGTSGANPGTPVSPPGGFSGGGLAKPEGCAADGAGNIWIVNYRGASITELQGAGGSSPGAALSGSTGFASGQVASPTGIAVDPSGNLWVSNSSTSSLTVLIGAAVPVRTPLIGPPVEP